jgi:hypothetical protein
VSQPKRYSLVASYYSSDAKMEAFEDGEFVRHADYAALKAAVERLRKAGDAVIEKLAEAYAGEPSDFDHAHVFKGWIEAKGEQPNK